MAQGTSKGRQNPNAQSIDWLAGGGEMGARIRSFNWSGTPLGSPQAWSPALRATLGVMLANRFPLLLWWGPDYISIYNDAYLPILGKKHPTALGLPVRECWSEIWDILKPLIDTPFNGGPSTWIEDFELHIQRLGHPEETHFTVAYSPVPDDTAPRGIGGVLATVHEITQKVIGERRVVILRDLGVQAVESTAEVTCRAATQTLARHGKDVPFALLYLIDADGRHARLAGTAGVEPGEDISPPVVALDGSETPAGWPLADSFRRQAMVTVTDLRTRFEAIPPGPWPDAPHSAVVVPIRSNKANELAALLVAGVSAHLTLDQHYCDFYELLASQIATAIATARTYEEERKRAEALAEIDRAKTAFFSNVSHEFRTPLTLMLGPLQDLKEEFGRFATPLSTPQYQQFDLIHRNGLRLLKLVNTLLDFSRIEAGRVQAVYEATDLAAYTAELASVFRSAIEKADLKLNVDCPPLSEPAFVDREMWEKIVLNLVSNAFKFTFEGEVEVKLRKTGAHVELIVRDTGTGIPADEVPKLFERFHRVAGARGRTHEGSGIGLALVQELARLHGGVASVESVYGKGSTFRVQIPAGKAHLPREKIGGERPQVSTALGAHPFVEEALRWLPDTGHASEPIEELAPAVSAQAGPGERRRIVVADDNVDMRDYVRRLLAPRYEVEAVADGEAALAAIEKRTPDLLLADIMMPRLDGLGLLARLRNDPRTRTLPVILLSARAGEEARVEGLAAGADDYLVKPFSARELLAQVAATIQTATVRREAEETLRESEERFRHMADNAPVMIWVTEPDGSCTFLSKSWYAFTGQTTKTGLGFGWLEGVHPDDRALARETLVAANAKGKAFRFEYRLRRKDGAYRWTLDAAAPRFGKGGEFLGYIGSAIDITERKRAEETQQLLINELNHRVKNTLASVQAIVQRTLRSNKNPADFVSTFAGRIQSMAKVQTLLSDTAWKGADLRDVIRDQLKFGPVDETRLTAWGPSVSLGPQTTQHVALMLHELGTNCCKYGALSTARGWVTIGWAVEGSMLRLKWTENGGPPASAPIKRGFGTTLIEQSAQSEGGRAQMSVEAGGIVWDIEFPLPQADAATRPATLSAELIDPTVPDQAQQRVDPESVLSGRRFLVVEDEPLVALDVIAGLEEAGADIVGSTGTIEEALQIIESTPLDAALLDANLRGHPVDDIAAALTRKQVPFIFVTGYGRQSLPRAFSNAPIIAKPYTIDLLIESATRILTLPADVVRLKN